MRLWGGHGQEALEVGHVCVLGSGATATECLKNLVLPNVGNFTVVDDAKVTVSDLGNNFFVTQDKLGQDRAEVVKENLCDLNLPDPDGDLEGVHGNHLTRNVDDLIKNEPEFFNQFSLVIGTQLYGESYELLAKHCHDNNIPLILARTNGLLGHIRLCVKELCIMESHPDDKRDDLYIYPPQLELFPALQEFINSYDMSNDSLDYQSIIPAPVIISKKLQEWQANHEEKMPTSWAEKEEFKKWMTAGKNQMRNWEETADYAKLAYAAPRIGNDCQAVLNDDAGKNLAPDCDNFWVCVRGLHDFMENDSNGFLPVTTTIPDFHSDTASYVTLKNLYKVKAAQDCEKIVGYIRARLTELGRDPNSISDDTIARFVKYCRAGHVERMRSVEEEFTNPLLEEINEAFDEFDMSMLQANPNAVPKPKTINWYFVFRVLDEFQKAHGRLPGSGDNWEADGATMKTMAAGLLTKLGLEGREVEENCLLEAVRFGGSEPHTTGAFLGGVVAQAALKILLRQYYPFNHTMVFDGVFCGTGCFKF